MFTEYCVRCAVELDGAVQLCEVNAVLLYQMGAVQFRVMGAMQLCDIDAGQLFEMGAAHSFEM